MKCFVFASGSQGNSTAIEVGNKIILIDLGITRSKIVSGLKEIGHQVSDIEAILITHDHSDHQKYIHDFSDLSDRIYSGEIAQRTNKLKCTTSLEDEAQLDYPYVLDVGDASIRAVELSHYSKGECVGYVIEEGNEKLVYITDTGLIYDEVKEIIKDATYYVFESNYDFNMLLKNKLKPDFLKNTILSIKGHLANNTMTVDDYIAARELKLMIDNPSRYNFEKEGAAEILADLINVDKTKGVILAHLSRDNNDPEVAIAALKEACKAKGKDLEAKEIEVIAAGDGSKGISHLKQHTCELNIKR